MNDVFFAGAKLDEDVRSEALAQLSDKVQVVVVPATDSRTLPNPWLRFPKGIAWLIADFFEWGAVVSRESLSSSKGQDPFDSQLAAAYGRQEVVVLNPAASKTDPRLPSLVPRDEPAPAWFQNGLEACLDCLGQPIRSKVDLIALRAGILQICDYLTASHEQSQSIEGRGRRQAGDYWHAINHRREPDYGNAKYWFRHVGSHPLLADLAKVTPDLAKEFSSTVQSKAAGLIEGGRLDPFRFVDLISDACRRKDEELIQFAERLQWIEMVGLLEETLRDTIG